MSGPLGCLPIVISGAEAERGFRLRTVTCTRVRNSFNSSSHIRFNNNTFVEVLANWDATPLVKSWLNSNHRLAADTRVWQKLTKAFCENQLAIWNLQLKCCIFYYIKLCAIHTLLVKFIIKFVIHTFFSWRASC